MRRKLSGLLVLGILGGFAVLASGSAESRRGRIESWMILLGDDSTVVNGSIDDIERVRELRSDEDEDLIWFRDGGGEYIVRDPALVREAKTIVAPQMELGRRQGELGSQQGKLGAEQGRLGARQGELGARQGALGARRGALAVRHALADESADAASRAEEEQIDAEMERLGEEMAALGEEMEPLGRDMAKLGEKMGALGREMERVTEQVEEQLRELFDRALAAGAAQPVRQRRTL